MPIFDAFLVVSWIAYVGFSVSGRSDFPWKQRRSHFRTRVAVTCLAAPVWLLLVLVAAHLVGETQTMIYVILLTFVAWVPAAAFAPALFYEREPQSPGGSDDDWGSDPDPSPTPPTGPEGGLPLPDAEPGRWRLRGLDRPKTHAPIERRPAHEPDQAPTTAT